MSEGLATSEPFRATHIAQAQDITADGTTDTTVFPFSSQGTSGLAIVGGTLRGNNLFHSFETFSPGTQYTLFSLQNRNGTYDLVKNVFSRVTGSNSTFIDAPVGLLGGNSPNLFLLNPNGISMGPNARLLLPGSFFGTTAEQINFSDGTTFSATDISTTPLLTISAPIGIQFGAIAAPIQWIGSGRDNSGNYTSASGVAPGKSLTLLSGNTNVEGTALFANSGLLQVGSVSPNTYITIEPDSHQVTYQANTKFKNISIEDSLLVVDASPNVATFVGASGDISLRGHDIVLRSSNVAADNAGAEAGGDIEVRATGNIEVIDSILTASLYALFDQTPSGGLPYTLYPSTGSGGNIYIEADGLSIRPETVTDVDIYSDRIATDTYSAGDAGDVTINASTVSLLGNNRRIGASDLQSARIASNAFSGGNGGNITINADNLNAFGDTIISSVTRAEVPIGTALEQPFGDGGDISLNITDTLKLDAGASIATTSSSNGTAGDLFVQAERILLMDQDIDPLLERRVLTTQLSTSSYREGDSGNLTIEASELNLSGTAAIRANSFAGSSLFPSGDGGRLDITSETISLTNGADIEASTYSDGDAGDLTIRADELRVAGRESDRTTGNSLLSEISAITALGGGMGGDLTLEVGSLLLESGGQVGAGTFGAGDAGEIRIRASERVDISGYVVQREAGQRQRAFASGIFSSAEPNSSGDGGSIILETPTLDIYEGGTLSVRTASNGNGGSLHIRADEVLVADPLVDPIGRSLSASGIDASVTVTGSGQGGLIDIESDRIHLYNGGQVSASSEGTGAAGSVMVRSGEVLIEGMLGANKSSNVFALDGSASDGLFGLSDASTGARIESAISSRSTTTAAAGSVDVVAERLELRDRGTITVSNTAGGAAGNVSLVSHTLKLDNGSIQAEASAGAQGNVAIDSQNMLLLRNGSRLSANAIETATGGNVSISAPLIVGVGNSDISANAVEGDGGSIQLVTQGLVGLAIRDRLTSGNDITASSEFGVSGVVNIDSPSTNANSGLVQLPDNLEDASRQVVASCESRAIDNQFTSSGRGGVPSNPFGAIANDTVWNDFRALEGIASEEIQKQNNAAVGEVNAARVRQENAVIREARQWEINASGQVELTAAKRVHPSVTRCLEQSNSSAS